MNLATRLSTSSSGRDAAGPVALDRSVANWSKPQAIGFGRLGVAHRMGARRTLLPGGAARARGCQKAPALWTERLSPGGPEGR